MKITNKKRNSSDDPNKSKKETIKTEEDSDDELFAFFEKDQHQGQMTANSKSTVKASNITNKKSSLPTVERRSKEAKKSKTHR